ncbi:amidohydrolase [Shinella sp. NM-101]|uniref:amidohydrolase family protein n=1 Tax=Shinella sp. NM-101 TaxID=2744455 RepID=UPI00092CE0F7|nr:amidohydrolase family protein [Shinella sp. NM-101]MBN9054043.1 amidohydrolase family protein [Hyphomicrobiales bacterium]OJV02266.1 MAG: amidohydrolase [Shinella sp. 65-6]
MIVDAHHHLWQVGRGDYDWMSPDVPVLARDYLAEDLRPVLRRAGVDRSVLVQAAQTEAETDFLLLLAAQADFVAGVVGWLDFEDAAFPAKLEALMRRPKFVGLRPMLQDHADDGYVLRPAVLANLRHLAAAGAAFDILTFPRHLPFVLRMLDAVPDLRAVVDHLSKPPVASGRLEGWAGDMALIAAHPGVFCKVSGLVTEARHQDWAPGDLAPYVRHVLDVFGADRLMFGSDWPVCLLAASYAEVMNAARGILDPLLDAEGMAKVFGGNAVRFYRL